MQYELYHHGILGMKWGIRRYQNKDGSLTPAGKRRRDKMSEEAIRFEDLSRKKPEELSNQELRQLNERQQLLNQYSNNKKSGVAKQILTRAALSLGTKYALKYGAMAIDAIIDSASSSAAENFVIQAGEKLVTRFD